MPTASGSGCAKSTSTSTTSTSVTLRCPRALLMRAGSTMGAMKETFPANSRPRKASARMTAGWPILISARSRSSSSARTRSAETSPMTSNGCALEGAASSPGLALTCATAPGLGGGSRNGSFSAAAPAASARATLTWPSAKVGSGVLGSASMRRSSAFRCCWRSRARARPERAISIGVFDAAPARLSTTALSRAAWASITALSASATASSPRRRATALSTFAASPPPRRGVAGREGLAAEAAGALSSLRARSRKATCASAAASRARASVSTSRTSGSPAKTLVSSTLINTWAITPMTGAAILIVPEAGSTRPGATVCQRLPSAASGRPARAPSCSPVLAASTASANATATAPRTADLVFHPVRFVAAITGGALAMVFLERGIAALFANDASVLDVNYAISKAQYTRVVRDDQHPARGILGDLGQEGHDCVAVLAIQRSRGLVRENRRRLSHDRPRKGDALLLAAAELERKCVDLARQADHRQGVFGLGDGAGGVVPAYVERQTHAGGGRQGWEQMIGLEDEAHVLAPESRQLLGPSTFRRTAPHADGAARLRDHASEDREKRSLAAAGGAHQQRQFAAPERQADTLESLHLRRPLSQPLHDIDGLDDGLDHRVNTITGSMRVTCTIAATAEMTHIRSVSRNSTKVRAGVITMGNAVSAVAATTSNPTPAATENPITALISAWQTMTLWI